MQVFNAFMKILKRKMFIALIYAVVFIAVALAITFSDNTTSMFEQTRLNVCLFDEDNTAESRALCDLIAERNDIRELANDRDTIIDALYYERVDYVLTIKSGYANKLANGNTDALFESMNLHDSYSNVFMGQFLNEYTGTVSAYIAGGSDITSAISKTKEALSQEAEVTVASFAKSSTVAIPQNAVFFFRYFPYIILGAVMSSLCPVLLVINRKDVRYRTNCSGIHPSSYTMQIFAASAVYITALWLVFMAVGVFVNGGLYSGTAWLAVLNSFVFTLFAATLTIFISSLSPSINVINIVTQIITITMSFLCGVFIDQSLLGEGVLAAARFFPAYWYIRVARMLDGTEVFITSEAALAIAIEAGFAALFAVLTLLVRKQRKA